MFTAEKGDSRTIEVLPSIVSPPVVKIVMLFVLALPASSLIVKCCPAVYPEAAGSLISKAEDADTPMICALVEAVIVVVTAVLLNPPPPGIVTVTLLLEFVAVTPAPTKSKDATAVVILEPSSFTIVDPTPSSFSSRYFPT